MQVITVVFELSEYTFKLFPSIKNLHTSSPAKWSAWEALPPLPAIYIDPPFFNELMDKPTTLSNTSEYSLSFRRVDIA